MHVYRFFLVQKACKNLLTHPDVSALYYSAILSQHLVLTFQDTAFDSSFSNIGILLFSTTYLIAILFR